MNRQQGYSLKLRWLLPAELAWACEQTSQFYPSTTSLPLITLMLISFVHSTQQIYSYEKPASQIGLPLKSNYSTQCNYSTQLIIFLVKANLLLLMFKCVIFGIYPVPSKYWILLFEQFKCLRCLKPILPNQKLSPICLFERLVKLILRSQSILSLKLTSQSNMQYSIQQTLDNLLDEQSNFVRFLGRVKKVSQFCWHCSSYSEQRCSRFNEASWLCDILILRIRLGWKQGNDIFCRLLLCRYISDKLVSLLKIVVGKVVIVLWERSMVLIYPNFRSLSILFSMLVILLLDRSNAQNISLVLVFVYLFIVYYLFIYANTAVYMLTQQLRYCYSLFQCCICFLVGMMVLIVPGLRLPLLFLIIQTNGIIILNVKPVNEHH